MARDDLQKQAREIIDNLEKDTAAPALRAESQVRERNVHNQETPVRPFEGGEDGIEVEVSYVDAATALLVRSCIHGFDLRDRHMFSG